MKNYIRQGEILQINGENIYPGGDTVAYWNSTSENNIAQIVSRNPDTGISIRVPEGLPDTNKIVLCNTVGCFTGTQEYQYIGTPQISSLNKTSQHWGKEIFAYGNHLAGVTGVFLNDIDGATKQASFDVPSKNKLTFYIPNEFSKGYLDVHSDVGSLNYEQIITGIVPPIEGSIISPTSFYYNNPVYIEGKSLHKVNRIKLEGLTNPIYLSNTQITRSNSTNISFSLPHGVRNNSSIYLQNQSGQYINGQYSTTIYEEFEVTPLPVYSPHIEKLNKSYGAFGEQLVISGVNLDKSKILFLDYNEKYTEANIVSSGANYKTVSVPKNIKNSRVIASGYVSPYVGTALSPSNFYPLPTIELMSTSSWEVGSSITVNAINAFDIVEAIAFTGSNLIKSGIDEIAFAANDDGLSNNINHFGIMSLDNSSMVGDASSGNTVISAVINSDIIGEGNPFLISKQQIQSEGSIASIKKNLDLYNIKENINSVTGQRVTIKGKQSVVLGLSKNKVSKSGELNISGKYFLGATGIELFGSSQNSKLTSSYFTNYSNSFRGVYVIQTGSNSLNNYEQLHYVSIKTKDFNFTEKSGQFKILTPYYG